MRGESGQATVEWVGLALLAALVLGGLVALRAPAEEGDFGRAVAERMTCAARATCPAVWRDTRSGSRSEAAAERATARLAGARAAASVRRRARARRPAGVSRARAVDAFRRLRGVGELAKRVWIVCLGYRRFLYELDHPRAPTEAMPLEEALDIADACLNPAAFIEEG